MRAPLIRVVFILMCLAAAIGSSANAFAQQLAPTDLHVTTSGSNVVITWRAGTNTAPDGFRLEAGSGPGLTDLAIVNIPWNAQHGLEANFRAAGVAPGIYYLRVRGVYNREITQASPEVVM